MAGSFGGKSLKQADHSHSITHISLDTVAGQHPAPPRMMIIPLFIGF